MARIAWNDGHSRDASVGDHAPEPRVGPHGGKLSWRWLVRFSASDIPAHRCLRDPCRSADLRIRGNVHPALIRGGLVVVVLQPVVLALGTTSAFLTLANLFR